MTRYPKRLIEVDLPIKRISAHARREKSIRHGHISTLHIWWARRPLAAWRAVSLAALWPDPVELTEWAAKGDEVPVGDGSVIVRPRRFLAAARSRMVRWATSYAQKGSNESLPRLVAVQNDKAVLDDPVKLREALLDFIADFANWENSTDKDYLDTARALVQAAHEALGGAPGTRPLVVDPFAGGGSIPLEALRVGADAFASDLNPIAVLLNKVVLEYIPKYGQRLADEVRKWGQWIREEAAKELAAFYPPQKIVLEKYHPQPKDKIRRQVDGVTWYLDGVETETPIAYLWARTILSQAPGQGKIPVEVPLMRSMWLAKKAGRKQALRWVRDDKGCIKTQTVEVNYVTDGKPTRMKVKRPLLEVFEPRKDNEVEGGTVARGSATCPVTGFTMKVDSVRAQLKQRRGGAADARLLAVVCTLRTKRYTGRREHFTSWEEQGRFYRLPTKADQAAFDAAAAELERREKEDGTSRSQPGRRSAEALESRRSLVPDEPLDVRGIRHTWAMIYGLERWGDLFSPRQALALTTLARLVRETGERMKTGASVAAGSAAMDAGLAEAVTTILALALGKIGDYGSSLVSWHISRQMLGHTFTRQALGFVWDFAEGSPLSDGSGNWDGAVGWCARICEDLSLLGAVSGHVEQAPATAHPLPDDAAAAVMTDPPYYDAVPYAYLSDFFYVWMRRTLADVHPALFREAGVPKDAEIVVDRPHQLSQSTKDIAFYERELQKAFAESRRVIRPDGVGCIVFASKTTASWEAILKAVIDAGWVITGSWPIDTEMETRVAAQGQARLGSSVHIVVRPRENPDGSLRTAEVGDWREVLAELPKRIHEWMPRLSDEGIVGADAIFACLGPALEVFSRYSRVEKASGEQVSLREYLEQVCAAVSKEALTMLFKDADAAGLEPDARLTAMWLWTLGTNRNSTAEDAESAEEEETEEEDSPRPSASSAVKSGFSLEFDAARKIAQGLGVHLEKIPTVVEVKGETARLLPVSERARHLFGKGADSTPSKGRGKKKPRQLSLFEELDEAEAAEGGWGDMKAPPPGATVLDRVHQAMILFAAGRSEAMRRFLVEEGIGREARFWKLAQALSALYPPGSEEKRWVDGVLARKKGLGL